jgi:hypothetical protein
MNNGRQQPSGGGTSRMTRECQVRIAIAVRNVSGQRRWSKLGEWLRPRPPASRQIGMAG